MGLGSVSASPLKSAGGCDFLFRSMKKLLVSIYSKMFRKISLARKILFIIFVC